MSFRPPWWATLATLAMLGVLCSLGRWQVHRGQAKEAMQAQFLAAAVGPVVDLALHTPPAQARVVARGTYDAQRQLLLDNQSHGQQPGYDVFTPLRLTSGALLMVNRGWVPRDGAHDLMPPSSAQEIHGIWRKLPEPGLKLATQNCIGAGWPRVVEYPAVDDFKCLLGETLPDGQLLLDPDQPGGFVRDWDPVRDFPPMRHYAYAAQWFALALTLLVIFIKLNLKVSR